VEPDIVVAHRTISEKETKVERKLKESDLKNHLESKFKEKPNDESAPKTNDSSKTSKKRAREDDLEKELLMSDNQILRALDILVSYDIFKHLSNG
jgi:carboxyl-terminal processing protease